jgi:hypothetical protein
VILLDTRVQAVRKGMFDITIIDILHRNPVDLPAGEYELQVIQNEVDFKDKGNRVLTPSPGKLFLGRGQRQRIQFTFVKADKNGWVQLFNGKDLDGWKTHPDQRGNWTVENGILVGRGPLSHLFTERGDFEDFHLRVEARIPMPDRSWRLQGDSGVFIRTPFQVERKPDGTVEPVGREVQILIGDYPAKTGSLLGIPGSDVVVEESLVNPDEWFTLEVIARANHIVTRVNDRTTVDVVDSRNPHRKGHLALQQRPPFVVHFRKIEIKEKDLPPSKPPEPATPFVILARDAGAERKFATPAEAVAAAQAGDTIEIRGNGPFVTEPLRIAQRLILRAGEGYRPILRLGAESVAARGPLMDIRAPLTLEGLELQRLNASVFKPGIKEVAILVATQAPLRATNCHFVISRERGPHVGLFCVHAIVSSACELRNCYVEQPDVGFLSVLGSPPGQHVVVENCRVKQAGIGIVLNYFNDPKPRNVRITVKHNTLVSNFLSPTTLQLNLPPKSSLPGADKADKPYQIESSENVLIGGWRVVQVMNQNSPEREALSGGEAEDALRRLVSYRERRNLYSLHEGQDFLLLYRDQPPDYRSLDPTRPRPKLADWEQFWALQNTGSLQGPLNLQDGFRLPPGSPGKKAGKDGRDLGADVDLVGPGAAYERWKKMPEYQEWLKRTGQFKPVAVTKCFVILASDAGAERGFATLADAVAAAQPGDTIEIRDNGPFVTESIPVDRPLTIRSGEGLRPVLRLSAADVAKGKPLMENAALLVVEGLELQRLNAPAWGTPGVIVEQLLRTRKAPLYAANCRFAMSRDGDRQHGLECVKVMDSPGCELRNCLLLQPGRDFLVATAPPPDAQMVVENCLIMAGGTFGLNYYNNLDRPPKNVRIALKHNTAAVVRHVLTLNLFQKPPVAGAEEGRKAYQLEASENLLSGGVLINSSLMDQVPTREEMEEDLLRLVGYREERNLYLLPDGKDFLAFAYHSKPVDPARSRRTVAEWERFWLMTESLQAKVQFQGYDVAAPAANLMPSDFRLKPGSPGKGAGKEGHDLGADVDLVGPGAAYERWKKMPEYEDWRKRTARAF